MPETSATFCASVPWPGAKHTSDRRTGFCGRYSEPANCAISRTLQLKRSCRHAYLALSLQIECARRITRLRLSAGDQLTGHHACGQCPFPHLIVSREVNMSGLSAFPLPSDVFACLSVEQGAEGNRPTDGRIKAARRG